MELFKIIVFEYLLGYALQGVSVVLGVYALNRLKIDSKKFWVTSAFFSVLTLIARLLPIKYGVHTILGIIGLFIVCILYIKLPPLNAIKSLLVITFLLIAVEMVNTFAMIAILGETTFNDMMSASPSRNIAGLPASLLFSLIMLISYCSIKKVKDTDESGKEDS